MLLSLQTKSIPDSLKPLIQVEEFIQESIKVAIGACVEYRTIVSFYGKIQSYIICSYVRNHIPYALNVSRGFSFANFANEGQFAKL